MKKVIDMDALEGRQLDKSWSVNVNAGVVGQAHRDQNSKEMGESLKAAVEKLPEYLQKQAYSLWEELMRLNIRNGVASKLMGMGHMGAIGDPIWKYIYKLHTEIRMSRIRDKGGWLVKCLMNDRLKG